ncbi:MAG TPA: hypothetical protein VIR26_08595 [Metalysinibacillus sp.]
MKIGRRIYYDIKTGHILLNTGERSGHVVPTTIEGDIEVYKVLSERNRDTFDYIELEYGQYREDFLHATSYQVNSKTKELVFSYDENEKEEETEPIYQEPLTEKVARLEKESLITMAALADKHEETLQLKKMNEDLRQTTLVALEGVAILNEEVQQIKKNSEASAN